MGGWWRWALFSPDRVAPSRRMVSVTASVNLPLHHKVQKFSSGTGSPAWSRKKGRRTVVVVVVWWSCVVDVDGLNVSNVSHVMQLTQVENRRLQQDNDGLRQQLKDAVERARQLASSDRLGRIQQQLSAKINELYIVNDSLAELVHASSSQVSP